MYFCIPGDQGGLIFLNLRNFSWHLFYVQIGVLQFVSHVPTCPILCEIVYDKLVCIQFVLLLVQIDIIQSIQ
jgi:hypothetical protein